MAQSRDQSELQRFARQTSEHEMLDSAKLEELEPDLAGRFRSGLFFEQEAHVQPHWALTHILQKAMEAGVETKFGTTDLPLDADYIIDCRGIAAKR